MLLGTPVGSVHYKIAAGCDLIDVASGGANRLIITYDFVSIVR